MADHYNDPPHDTVEPPGYQSWRTKLSNNFSEAFSTANGDDNDNFKFWNNTEVKLLSLLKKAPKISHEVIFGWDLDGGVWILDPTATTDNDMSIYAKLHTLLKEEFMHWNQALAECGAEYYRNWRDAPYGRAAVAAHAEPWGYSRPYFMTKEAMESATRGIRNVDRVAEDTQAKLT
ncbi:hypothetical protein MW887_007634 [Aspergillus wentii]|nr:hypothetical protein MW887_007634 [Aspergillus wentii]